MINICISVYIIFLPSIDLSEYKMPDKNESDNRQFLSLIEAGYSPIDTITSVNVLFIYLIPAVEISLGLLKSRLVNAIVQYKCTISYSI